MSDLQRQQPSPAEPKRGWWSRNWIWVLIVALATPIVLGCGCFSIIFFGLSASFKTSEVYQQGLARAQANEEVQAKIGEPIEAGFFTSGSIEISGASGRADMAIPISGPKGSATIHAVANKSAGRWSFTTLEVAVNGAASRIDLLADE